MGFSLKQLGATCKNWLDWSARRKAYYCALEEKAKQGDKQAIYKLISLYPAFPKYYPLALQWTKYQAHQGKDCLILVQLAQMLEGGYGAVADEKQALTWYERALSLHILQGKHSSLSVEQANLVQNRIQALRQKMGWN